MSRWDKRLDHLKARIPDRQQLIFVVYGPKEQELQIPQWAQNAVLPYTRRDTATGYTVVTWEESAGSLYASIGTQTWRVTPDGCEPVETGVGA